MKNWIYYVVPLALLIGLVMLPSIMDRDKSGGAAPAPVSAFTPGQGGAGGGGNAIPASTPWQAPASNPSGQMLDINFLDLKTNSYQAVAEGGTLPADTFHFNVKFRNTGRENTLFYIGITQNDGAKLEPMGAAEWPLPPGQEVALFMQGANLKPAGKVVVLTFVLRERVTDKVLDQRAVSVTSR